MRRLYLILFLLMSIYMNSQTVTEKYNSLMNRYEYYNASGNMIGYKTYDNLMNTWNYYDVPQQAQTQSNYQYVQPINLQLVNQALADKQTKYDANTKSVQNAINQLRTNVNNSAYSANVINSAIFAFNEQCVKVLNNKSYDYSSNSVTTQIINWLYSNMNNFVQHYIEQEKLEQKKANELRSQIANEMVYNAGGYSTNDVTDEKYNPYTKSYEVTSKDTTRTKVFFDNTKGLLYYYRQKLGVWRYYTWKYKHADDRYHVVSDIYSDNIIEIGVNFDWIVFYEDKVGDVYTKRYTYRNLKKDSSIKKE